jgi:hypothetical protein
MQSRPLGTAVCVFVFVCVCMYVCVNVLMCTHVCALICVCSFVCMSVSVCVCLPVREQMQESLLFSSFFITAARFENVQGTWHSPYGFGGTGCGVWTRAGVYFLRAASVEAQTAALVRRVFSFYSHFCPFSVLLRPLPFRSSPRLSFCFSLHVCLYASLCPSTRMCVLVACMLPCDASPLRPSRTS